MSSRNEKRARQKEFRDQKRAAAWAAYRRQRFIRIAGVLLFVVVLAVAIGTSLGGDDEPNEGANPAASPSASEPTAAPTEADTSGEVACGGERPEPAAAKQYDKPKQVLKDGVDYSAVISTSCGDITLDLLEDEAQETVNNFVFLAQEGYFDGLIWHRVERNFVIQTGDPNGLNGVPPDGPGYAIKDELPRQSREYVLGTLAMANSGPDTGGSQIFIITHGVGKDGEIEPAGLPKAYAIFGQVDEASFEVLELLDKLKIQGGDNPTTASMPTNPAFINSIEIIEN